MLLLCRIYKTLASLLAPTASRTDHFALHAEAGFEGYYSRIQLEDTSTLVVVFDWVKDAQERARIVHVSYTPARTTATETDGEELGSFKHEFFSDTMSINVHPPTTNGQVPFSVSMAGIGTMKVTDDSVDYRVSCGGLELDLHLTHRVPWSSHHFLSGPMGFLTRISALLPLNWHVYSTASIASGTLSYDGKTRRIAGVAHAEKNWGTSFPSGWIWSQSFAARKAESGSARSLALAGGEALPGVQAYLVGYRTSKLEWDFRPPFTVALGPLSPFMSARHDSVAGTVNLSVQTFTKKLEIKINAPPDSYMSISCPLPEGHRTNFAYESFAAHTFVSAWERRWPWQTWTLVDEGECGERGCSALEFGGSYDHRVREESVKTR